MTVTDVEINHARAARPSPDRVAVAYLAASGVTAIGILASEAGCTFRAGLTGPPRWEIGITARR
jgi:hypothetical protein